MARRVKTKEQLQEQVKKHREAIKQLEKQQREITKAEEAELNAQIVEAVKNWCDVVGTKKYNLSYKDLPGWFSKQTKEFELRQSSNEH